MPPAGSQTLAKKRIPQVCGTLYTLPMSPARAGLCVAPGHPYGLYNKTRHRIVTDKPKMTCYDLQLFLSSLDLGYSILSLDFAPALTGCRYDSGPSTSALRAYARDERGVGQNQCASSQLWPTPMPTMRGTLRMMMVSMSFFKAGGVVASSSSGISKTSSS